MSAAALTPEHHYQLKRFVRLVDEMSRCRFITAYRTQDQTVGAGEDDAGGEWRRNPTYDFEDLRSFLTTYRQVGHAKNDKPSVNLKDVLDVVDLYAGPELRRLTADIRATTLPHTEGRYSAFRFAKFKGDFEVDRCFTSGEVLKALLNGLIFHPDKRHAETIDFLEEDGVEPWMYLWPVMNEIVEPTLRACLALFRALRADGVLGDEDYPARCFDEPLPATGPAERPGSG